jgi:hypothetical protein
VKDITVALVIFPVIEELWIFLGCVQEKVVEDEIGRACSTYRR